MSKKVLGQCCLVAVAVFAFASTRALAQYQVTDLVSNQNGAAPQTDANLVNGWGLSRGPTTPFWVSDNVTGKATLYTGAGAKVPLVVTIPAAPGNTKGTPTGTVFNITVANSSPSFLVTRGGTTAPSLFIFATLDGTISAWNLSGDIGNATRVADRSGVGANYTGLAIASTSAGDFLFAADNGPNSRVDVFNSQFTWIASFTDPNINGGFAPYGIQNLGGNIWVTFGGNKSASGFVDEFTPDGTLLQHIAVNGPLHSPWGLAMAPATGFGPFSGALLVANNIPKGRIDAFDPSTGAFLGVLRDSTGRPIEIDQLWAIMFGHAGNNGSPTQLFFSAGPNNYANGRFGMITFAP
ncbi:MAG TPA: TIGR03118 family protein [Candidatus Angelobacter sp.]|nr:TIGR03118 family protein [Candidatus Angelobacter sp.]